MTSRRAVASMFGVLAATTLAVLPVVADDPEGPPSFEITKFTIDSGGGSSSGGIFELQGTIGQADAQQAFAGGDFEATGGYWGPSDAGGVSCLGDTDGSGTVDTVDLLAMLSSWGPCVGCPSDLDGDNVVNTVDLLTLLSAWGLCK